MVSQVCAPVQDGGHEGFQNPFADEPLSSACKYLGLIWPLPTNPLLPVFGSGSGAHVRTAWSTPCATPEVVDLLELTDDWGDRRGGAGGC